MEASGQYEIIAHFREVTVCCDVLHTAHSTFVPGREVVRTPATKALGSRYGWLVLLVLNVWRARHVATSSCLLSFSIGRRTSHCNHHPLALWIGREAGLVFLYQLEEGTCKYAFYSLLKSSRKSWDIF